MSIYLDQWAAFNNSKKMNWKRLVCNFKKPICPYLLKIRHQLQVKILILWHWCLKCTFPLRIEMDDLNLKENFIKCVHSFLLLTTSLVLSCFVNSSYHLLAAYLHGLHKNLYDLTGTVNTVVALLTGWCAFAHGAVLIFSFSALPLCTNNAVFSYWLAFTT